MPVDSPPATTAGALEHIERLVFNKCTEGGIAQLDGCEGLFPWPSRLRSLVWRSLHMDAYADAKLAVCTVQPAHFTVAAHRGGRRRRRECHHATGTCCLAFRHGDRRRWLSLLFIVALGDPPALTDLDWQVRAPWLLPAARQVR